MTSQHPSILAHVTDRSATYRPHTKQNAICRTLQPLLDVRSAGQQILNGPLFAPLDYKI
jgi:hypothetical protein